MIKTQNIHDKTLLARGLIPRTTRLQNAKTAKNHGFDKQLIIKLFLQQTIFRGEEKSQKCMNTILYVIDNDIYIYRIVEMQEYKLGDYMRNRSNVIHS